MLTRESGEAAQRLDYSAPNGFGGGINSNRTLTLPNSTVSGNSAIDGGGGILNEGTATLVNSTVSGMRPQVRAAAF